MNIEKKPQNFVDSWDDLPEYFSVPNLILIKIIMGFFY